MQKIIALYRGLIVYAGLFFIGSTGLFLKYLSFGFLQSFYQEVYSPLLSKAVLLLIGIRVRLPSKASLPQGAVIYIFNHNSYLDLLLVPALGLPQTHFLISSSTKKVLPLYLGNLASGSFFVPTKSETEARKSFFQEMGQKLRAKNMSVICSPEGQHTFTHAINSFNTEVFAMAQASQLPLCPLFFDIPLESNPLESYYFKSGTVHIEVMPMIRTEDWFASDIQRHKESVQAIFQEKFNSLYGLSS